MKMSAKIDQRSTINDQRSTINDQRYNYVQSLPTIKLNINGQTLEYKHGLPGWIPLKEENAAPLFHKTKELFDRAGIKFAIAFGTLLGAVREKGVIKSDTDMDIYIQDEKKLYDNLINFQNEGLFLCRFHPGYGYTFRVDYSGCFIDVYIMRELRGLRKLLWGRECISLVGFVMPRKLFQGYEKTEFLGEECLCPANPENLLEWCYGSDWRIPQDKKGRYEITPAIYYRKLTSPFVKIARLIFDKNYRIVILHRKKTTGSFFFFGPKFKFLRKKQK